MKRTIYFFLIILLVSCEREIGEFTEVESPKLVVNALLIAGEESQTLRVSMTGKTEVTPVTDAEVTVRVNGIELFSATSNTDKLIIPTKDLKPGDIVSVSAQKGTLRANAEVEVPQPIEITGIDTMTVNAKIYPTSNELTPHTRYLVHLRLPENMHRNKTQYLRVEILKDTYEPYVVTEIDGKITDIQYKLWYDHRHFSYAQDPALTENENLVFNENSDVEIDWLEGNYNNYHVFRSAYFNDNGEYTLRLDLQQPSTQWGWYQDVRIRVFTISQMEYNYLQALTNLKANDQEILTEGEPTMPSNILNGAGIFCIETLTEKRFLEDHRILMTNE